MAPTCMLGGCWSDAAVPREVMRGCGRGTAGKTSGTQQVKGLPFPSSLGSSWSPAIKLHVTMITPQHWDARGNAKSVWLVGSSRELSPCHGAALPPPVLGLVSRPPPAAGG